MIYGFLNKIVNSLRNFVQTIAFIALFGYFAWFWMQTKYNGSDNVVKLQSVIDSLSGELVALQTLYNSKIQSYSIFASEALALIDSLKTVKNVQYVRTVVQPKTVTANDGFTNIKYQQDEFGNIITDIQAEADTEKKDVELKNPTTESIKKVGSLFGELIDNVANKFK